MCCFPIACANACIYFGKEITDEFLLDSFNTAKCINGSTINELDTLDYFKLNYKKVKNITNKCGIINIKHAKYNLHSLFYFPEFNLVNSLLNKNVYKIEYNELLEHLPKYKNQQHYYEIIGVK